MVAPSLKRALSEGADAQPSLERWAGNLRLTRTVAAWLQAHGHRDPVVTADFLDPKLKQLTPPEGMADRESAARRIALAIRKGQRIVVFGDYDCDGITSAAIMTELIASVGGRVKPLLASRFDGGYGVSAAATARIRALEPNLLITCDCGSSDHEALSQLQSVGVEIVVIDHHLVPDRPLPAVAFLNPHRPECAFPYKGLASCGLALSIAAALRKELDVQLDVRRWLDLVAIGTIADVAPLDGDNRKLVRAGLLALRQARRPGIAALLELAKVSTDTPLTGRDVAFRLAPHLNAPGRMGAPDKALDLLLARTAEDAQRIASDVVAISAARREQQEQMLEQAVAEIEQNRYAERSAIVVGNDGWNPGIVGIVAGRLVDRYQKPVVVLGFEGANGRGSVRGPRGVRLHEALSQIQDCLVRFGGHQAAAGLELEAARLDELRQRFETAIEAQTRTEQEPQDGDTLPLQTGDHPYDVLLDMDRLEPCGEGNPRPRIVVHAQVSQAREVTGGHLKLELNLGEGLSLGGFAVRQGERASTLHGDVRVTGDLRHTTFPGSGGVEIFVETLEERSSN